MLRKILIATTAVAAMCVGSPAMAMHGGGGFAGGGGHVASFAGGGSHVSSFGGGGGWHAGNFGGDRIAGVHGGGAGPMMTHGGTGPAIIAPPVNGRDHGWNGNVFGRNGFAWERGRDHFHDHFHHHHFFANGFAGSYYDYDYDSCWAYDGRQWIYVCGDYAY